MEEKLVWTEKGREAPVDRQVSSVMLLDMLRENVAGVLEGFRLENSDDNSTADPEPSPQDGCRYGLGVSTELANLPGFVYRILGHHRADIGHHKCPFVHVLASEH